jgi:hypothetical protein
MAAAEAQGKGERGREETRGREWERRDLADREEKEARAVFEG